MSRLNPFDWPRWIVFPTALGLLVILGYLLWAGEHQRFVSRLQAIKTPDEYAGTRVCVGYLRIESKEPWGVVGRDRGGYAYRLVVDPQLLETGQRYSFKGTITEEGRIRTDTFQHHPHNDLKYVLSLLSLVLVLYIIRIYIRFDPAMNGVRAVNLDRGLFGSPRGDG